VIDAKAEVPLRPIGVQELLPVLQELSGQIVAAAERQTARRGKGVSCRAGCGACCRQLVPISEPEARALALLVEAMPAERRAKVEQRFREAYGRLEAAGLLERLRDFKARVPAGERRAFAMEYFRAGVACPFLEEESCSIHPERPISCREYLVTSEAALCADPAPGRIEMVPLPAKASEVLYRFGDGEGRDAHHFLPLVTALEWTERHRGETAATLPGPKLLENFVRQLAG
jgi:Fe-S-cluster containining protein